MPGSRSAAATAGRSGSTLDSSNPSSCAWVPWRTRPAGSSDTARAVSGCLQRRYSEFMPMDLIGIAGESTVRIEPDCPMSSEEFFDFCQANSSWRIERMADGEIVIMPPAGMESDHHCVELAEHLNPWSKRDGRGKSFG